MHDIPDSVPVFQYIAKHYHFDEAVKDVKAQSFGLVALPVDDAPLRAVVLDAIDGFGLHGMRCSDPSDTGYESLSLVYNPDVDDLPYKATLGTEKLTAKEHYYATPETIAKLGGKIKGSYYDSYGFCTLTVTGKFIEKQLGYKRTPIRSRISAIKANHKATSNFQFGWHKDETVFENLRVNIPITTAPEYRLQIEQSGNKPFFYSRTMSDHHLEVGRAYTWDTHLPHRVYSKTPGTVDRLNIVLGFSPWFDYDPVNNSWQPNEFFGKKHPIQMLLDGDVIEAIHETNRSPVHAAQSA